MQNLNGLIPTIYAGLSVVSRELIGFIPSVSTDVDATGAALGQVIRSPVAGTSQLEDVVASETPPDTGDVDNTHVDVTITKSKAYPIKWTGEEQLSVGANGVYQRLIADQFAQAFRSLANAVEADLGALYTKTSRAVGVAGTTPFGVKDNHMDFANANRTLDEVGAPAEGRVMILGSSARANIEGIQAGLFKANEAGTDALLRNREGRQLHNFTLGYSAGIQNHVAGNGVDYLVNGVLERGAAQIAVDTGTGTMVAGDVIEIDGKMYVVNTALAGGDVVIGSPGLQSAAADDTAVTVGGSYAANMFFHRSALVLAARPPAMPMGGDSARDTRIVTDPVSGLSFQVCLYAGHKQVKIQVELAWGVAAPNSKFCGLLLG